METNITAISLDGVGQTLERWPGSLAFRRQA